MRQFDRIALISMIVFASVLGSFATNYILGNAIATGNAAPRGENGSKTEMTKLGSAARGAPMPDGASEQDDQPLALAFPAPPAQPFRNDPTREKKTLAVLILMLRDGRGAR